MQHARDSQHDRDILPRLGATLDEDGVVRNLEVLEGRQTVGGRGSVPSMDSRRIESVIGECRPRQTGAARVNECRDGLRGQAARAQVSRGRTSGLMASQLLQTPRAPRGTRRP